MKKEPDERLLRVRYHIIVKYEIKYEDDDYPYHNKHVERGNKPVTMKDIPMEVDTKNISESSDESCQIV